MSAQRPGKGLSPKSESGSSKQWAGSRAFVFYPGVEELGYDYLTQLLPAATATSLPSPSQSMGSNDDTLLCTSSLPTAGEFMFGGGAMLGGKSEKAVMDALGVANDGDGDFEVQAYLGGALERYFWNHWEKEGDQPDTEESNPPGAEWGKGRVKAFWTGIVAISADSVPWVGRVPASVSGRCEPTTTTGFLKGQEPATKASQHTALPGEWISAGYSGEGMVHAWLCGRAVARMVLGIDESDTKGPKLPAPFLITDKRVKKAKIEDLLNRLGN